MKKLTWALLSLMLFLGLGTAFAQNDEGGGETPTVTLPTPVFDPAGGTVQPGASISIGMDDMPSEYAHGFVFLFYTFNDADNTLETTVDKFTAAASSWWQGGSLGFSVAVAMGEDWEIPCAVPEDAAQGENKLRARLVVAKNFNPMSMMDGEEDPEAPAEVELVYGPIAQATYTVEGEVAALPSPTFDPVSGTAVESGTKVALHYEGEEDESSFYVIYYVLNNPDFDFSRYTMEDDDLEAAAVAYDEGTKITITAATTIKAALGKRATDGGISWSEPATASYTIKGGDTPDDPTPATKPAAPTFDPNGGEIEADAAITLETTTQGAKIYYINGTTASFVSLTTEGELDEAVEKDQAKEYQKGAKPALEDFGVETPGEKLSISAAAVLIAEDGGLTWSEVTTKEFTVAGGDNPEPAAVAIPVITPANDAAVHMGDMVTIVCETEGAEIYYTTDGTKPFTMDNDGYPVAVKDGALKYEDPFALTESMLVKQGKFYSLRISAVATKDGAISSNGASAGYAVYPNAPTFDPVAGAVEEGTKVAISCVPTLAEIYYTTDGTTPTEENSPKYTEPIEVTAAMTIKAIAVLGNYQTSGSASYTIKGNEPTPTKPAAPTFAEPLEVKQGEGLKIDLPEDLDLADYLDGAFILYVENDDETELSYEGTWNELLAWAQGVRGGSDDEDPGYPGFPDDDLGGGGYALTVDEEPVAEPAYKVAYYDAEEEMWRPAAFLATAGDAVKVRACLAVGKDANGTLIYSDEFNATYKVTANTLKTPVFFVNGEELKTATVKVTPGTQVSFESGYEEADEADDYEYMICYAFDATEEDFDNASAWGMKMDPTSKVKMYDPELGQIKVNKSGKLMARVAQMYRDGHIWWSASKEVTFEIDFVIEVSPLLGEDTFGKNIALGVSVNIGETNPIGMPIYADNKYPTAVYYTTDGTTEPSKAAYDAQADKVNGVIKKVENTLDEDGWAVTDGNENNISLPLFDKDIHLKAKAYVTKDEETVETVLFDKALKVKAGANPEINPVSGTVVKAGDKIVVKNPAPLPDDDDDEYGGYGGDGDGDLSEAALGTLYFSFDGTLPTEENFGLQKYDEENEADPYHAWSVWKAEGQDVEITIQEDARGLYAYVPAIGEYLYTPQKDTIRLEGGMLSVQAWCLTEMEAGKDPRTGMPMTFKCGSDFVTAAYTIKGEDVDPGIDPENPELPATVKTPTFVPAAGAVEKGQEITWTWDEAYEAFMFNGVAYVVNGEDKDLTDIDAEAFKELWNAYGDEDENTVREEGVVYLYVNDEDQYPYQVNEACTIKACLILALTKDGEEGEEPELEIKFSSVVTAAYTIKGETPVVETVAKPTFNPAAGEVEKGTKVEIACETEGAVIYYTVDGSEPTDKSTKYEAAIVINEAVTVKAIAVKGDAKSEVATAAYTVKTANEGLELSGVSVYPNPSNGMFNLELPCAATVEVFMSNGMLYQRINANAGNATLNINRSGIYFLRITGEGRTAIKRVIVR